MSYSLMLYTPGAAGHIVRSGITEEVYARMVKARDNLRDIQTVVDYYNMFLGNANEFIAATKQIWPSQIKGWAEVNRRFLNMVSTFYAYIEYLENTYKEIIAAVKAKYFDLHFEYRLVYNLRKYATHREPAIYKATYDVLSGAASIKISPERLLERGELYFQPVVREELKRMAETKKDIDVAILAEEFKKIFARLNNDVMLELDVIAAKANELLYSFYVQNNKPSEYDICNEAGEYLWSISGVLVKYREKMQFEREK